MGEVKIEDLVYKYTHCSFEQALYKTSPGKFYIQFDIGSFPSYEKIFFDLYQNQKKFKLSSNKFISKDSQIIMVDFNSKKKKMFLTIKSDNVTFLKLDERRGKIIDNLLNKSDNTKEDGD